MGARRLSNASMWLGQQKSLQEEECQGKVWEGSGMEGVPHLTPPVLYCSCLGPGRGDVAPAQIHGELSALTLLGEL